MEQPLMRPTSCVRRVWRYCQRGPDPMSRLAASIGVAFALALGLGSGQVAAQAQPDGQLTVAFDVSIALTFLDPAETPGIGVPFVFLYALHDALIKPLPGNDTAPCLAESWTESADGLVYEFKLREGLKFHNGDSFTAEDVKFSFLRYRGASAKLLHDRVKAVDIVDPRRVRFVLHTPWPDFLVFYASPATGAAWIVPKKYIEKVGEEGFRRQPVGLGPYRFARMTPGVELVLEANERYWRKRPSVKRVVIKSVPDRTTRLAMLKTGEADIAYVMIGLEAITIKTDPKLRLATVIPPATWWMEYTEQWNPKSPWSDRRVRLAANLAVDKQGLNEAERLGFSRLTGSIIPANMESALRLEPYPYDPRQAKRLLAEAGYPNGFDAGDLTPMPPFTTMGEAGPATSPPWVFARGCAAWSGRRSWRRGGRRSWAGSSRRPRRRRVAQPCDLKPSSSAARPTPLAGIPTSTISFDSRRKSATAGSVRPSCTGSSASCTNASCSARSSSPPSSMVSVRGWRSPRSA